MSANSFNPVQLKAKLIQTLPYYQEQDKAFDKFVTDGFAIILVSGDKKRAYPGCG